MNDLHIDDFYKDVAKIFLQLFKSFPQKSILYVEDICGPDDPDEFGLHSPRFQSCFSTVIWLAEANYLSYSSNIHQEAFEETVLSHQGFTFLTSRNFSTELAPSNDQTALPSMSEFEHQTRIATIRHTLKNESSNSLSVLMHRYMCASRDYS